MLGCMKPMSSPMMKRMLGFCCCCADAGALAIEIAAVPANKPSHNVRDTFMAKFLLSNLSGSSAQPSNDAPESQVACRRVHVLSMAGRGAVAAAVIRRAKMRTAFNNLAGNLGGRQARIVAIFLAPAARIFGNAARFGSIRRMLRGPPVSGPFPDIADHVVDAVTIGRKRGHRRGAVEAVLAFVFVWKISLPGIGHVFAAGRKRFAPSELGAVEPAACGEFPLGLGWQVLARPFGVGQRIRVSDMDNGMIVERVYIALRPIGMTPICVFQISPPLAE